VADAPLSPIWWVKRLHKALLERCRTDRYRLSIDDLDAYYRGRPTRLPWLPEQARDEFYRLLELTKSNYMGLVVDATAERLAVEGFRIGDDSEADSETWDIWQNSNFDNDSDQAILEALITGQSYALVTPGATPDDLPMLFAEHPAQAIVAYAPGSGRRAAAAGLKVWEDDWTGRYQATLYLPDWVYKFEAVNTNVSAVDGINWQRRNVRGETWPIGNPLGEVQLVELPNNPRLLTGGVSELADVTAVQDRICKTLADRLMTQDYGAFPQKWAIGFPEEDAQGRANRIDVGRNRMVTSDIAETRFGQWESAALDPYSAAKREDVKDIASRTRTPAQYLLGEMSNVNGETLKAAESGLVSKVRQRQRSYGESLERLVGLARRAAGLGDPAETVETIWRNPEFRTEGELVDALVKMAGIGVPHEALWERWGATPLEISRWKAMAEEATTRDIAGQITALTGQQMPAMPAGDQQQMPPGVPSGPGN
jgi:hypothetical protein